MLPEHFASYAHIKKANIEEMIEKVTQPLLRRDGIEALQDIVVEIKSRLRKGLLQDPWEVEVALLSNGRVSAVTSFLMLSFTNIRCTLVRPECTKGSRKLSPFFMTTRWDCSIQDGETATTLPLWSEAWPYLWK